MQLAKKKEYSKVEGANLAAGAQRRSEKGGPVQEYQESSTENSNTFSILSSVRNSKRYRRSEEAQGR
jgi:hypothetical protein